VKLIGLFSILGLFYMSIYVHKSMESWFSMF